MKTMTCAQLGGACDMEFHASTFEEIAELSKKHGIEMAEKNDELHLRAMDEMRMLMKDPNALQQWMEDRKNEFDALPDNS